MNPEKVAETLERAADILAENGVTKGSFAKPKADAPKGYCFCSYGALRMAAGGRVVMGIHVEDYDNKASYLAASVLAEHVDDEFNSYSVIDFNDHPNRKPETIIRAFREAARKVRSGEITV